MRQAAYLNEDLIRKTISILKPNNRLFEVRVFGGTKKQIFSGYFRDADTLIKAFDNIDVRDKNIYITLNCVKDALYSRMQHDKFLQVNQTTSDTEIEKYVCSSIWIQFGQQEFHPVMRSSNLQRISQRKFIPI